MPFIIWDTKGEIPSGKTDDTTVVSALDLYKSLSSLAGIKLPADCKSDGMDMSAALKGFRRKGENLSFGNIEEMKAKHSPGLQTKMSVRLLRCGMASGNCWLIKTVQMSYCMIWRII